MKIGFRFVLLQLFCSTLKKKNVLSDQLVVIVVSKKRQLHTSKTVYCGNANAMLNSQKVTSLIFDHCVQQLGIILELTMYCVCMQRYTLFIIITL